MKKYISIITAALMVIGIFTACGKVNAQATPASMQAEENSEYSGEDSANKLKIVTTIFPEYDWVMNVLGEKADNADVTMLLDNGVDLHSYQPTPDDILKIATCDVFIYVGGESDKWVDDALKEATNKDMKVINLLDVLGNSVKEEEVVEGMEAEEEEEESGEEEECEYDEHVWLSLRNARVLVERISDTLQTVDTENADIYKANAEAYAAKLDALDTEYKKTVDESENKTLLFGDRFPFRYLVDDYGLDYYAAFVGCSAETEASFETVTFLAGKVDELSLNAVMTIEGKDHKIAETIISNTKTKNQKILTMDSMQSTTMEDVKGGTSYLSVMENNLSILKEALDLHENSDIDLTAMGADMVYATVYQMMAAPENYEGKTIKMHGTYYNSYYEPNDTYYKYCIIKDALACCSQGLEFESNEGIALENDEEITVKGVFKTYTEDGKQYCHIVNSKVEKTSL